MTVLEVGDDVGRAAGLAVAAAELRAGRCVAIPTDTVYGLAAALASPDAVAQLATLKDRPPTMPIAVLVADLAQAEGIARLGAEGRSLALRHWPGSLTLVADGAPGIGSVVGTDDGSVGVRCPDHAFVQALAARVGPLATTSANRHQEAPAATASAVAARFPALPLIIDGGVCDAVPSTVADVRVVPPVILRQGSIDLA